MPIEIKDLAHIYHENTPMEKIALNHIDLTIQDKEMVALIGETGSGKSTLVQHLNALLLPTSGEILSLNSSFINFIIFSSNHSIRILIIYNS